MDLGHQKGPCTACLTLQESVVWWEEYFGLLKLHLKVKVFLWLACRNPYQGQPYQMKGVRTKCLELFVAGMRRRWTSSPFYGLMLLKSGAISYIFWESGLNLWLFRLLPTDWTLHNVPKGNLLLLGLGIGRGRHMLGHLEG